MSENNDLLRDEPGINSDTDCFEQAAESAADDNFDGTADCTEGRLECYTQEIEDVLKSAEVPKKGINLSKPAVAVVSAIAAVVVCAVIVAVAYAAGYNAYNANKDGYMPTLEDLAAEYEMSVDEIKDAYGLPKDMRGDTIAAVALNYMPAGLYVEMNYRLPFDTAVEAMGLAGDERVNENMRYGDFEKILEEVEIAQPEETQTPAEEAEEPAESPAAE
ncbi:MAG: hypothetical protein IJ300_05710 [Clostridia bacterium]|nr:hypothetical protein [Clostridia bacterium]